MALTVGSCGGIPTGTASSDGSGTGGPRRDTSSRRGFAERLTWSSCFFLSSRLGCQAVGKLKVASWFGSTVQMALQLLASALAQPLGLLTCFDAFRGH